MLRPSRRRALSIAYLTYRGKPHVGGQGVYTRHLTKALVDLGHSVEVFGGQPYPCSTSGSNSTSCPVSMCGTTTFPDDSPGTGSCTTRPIGRRRSAISAARSASRWRSASALAPQLTPRQRDFDIVHDNQCLGYSILGIEKLFPTIVTLHHPITRDRALEMAHTPTWRKRYSIGRWYNFVKMQGRVASRMPRIVVVSENSIKDIHADMGVSLDRMRLVPVGVDPELFTPLPGVARHPGPADHHCVGRRGVEGSFVPARGDGQVAHRTRRHA